MALLALRPRVNRSFEGFYRRHAPDVYHYALAVLRSPRAAEDVTKATFRSADAAYRRGEAASMTDTWVIATAHDLCRERLGQSAPAAAEAGGGDDGAARVDDEIPSTRHVTAALERLPFAERLAFVMRDLEGRSYTEIAATLGVAVPAAETLVFRARRMLRERLGGPLTCEQAELAISRQLDGRLPRAEEGPLRAHLGGCRDCAAFATRQVAYRAAMRSLSSIALPPSLASSSGTDGTRRRLRLPALLAFVRGRVST